MALSLDQIRTFVRLHLDLDTEDLPDVVLDVFVREGSKRVEKAVARWPFFESSWPLTTVASQATYTFASVSPLIDQLAAVTGDTGPLQWIGMDLYEANNPANTQRTGRPQRFAWWNDTLYLDPEPDAAYNLTLRGYRKPTDWVAAGAGANPDLPDELHNTVALWALAKSYSQQEDPELGAVYERQFTEEVEQFKRRIYETPHPQPLVLNGQPMAAPGPFGRLRFPWEA